MSGGLTNYSSHVTQIVTHSSQWITNIFAKRFPNVFCGTCNFVRNLLYILYVASHTQEFNKFAQSNLGRGPRHATIAHLYAVKSPLVTMARPKFAPKSTPFRGPIHKPRHLPHAWIRPTYHAKRHPDPIQSAVFPQCTGPVDRRTHRQTDRSSTGKFDEYSPLRL